MLLLSGNAMNGGINMGVRMYRQRPANEISREELLRRDVGILFNENRGLKERLQTALLDVDVLKKQNLNLAKQVGRLKGTTDQEEEEAETFEEIAFYINQQRLSLGLSVSGLAILFNLSRPTVSNYINQKGSYKNAVKFSARLRSYVKEYGKRH